MATCETCEQQTALKLDGHVALEWKAGQDSAGEYQVDKLVDSLNWSFGHDDHIVVPQPDVVAGIRSLANKDTTDIEPCSHQMPVVVTAKDHDFAHVAPVVE